MQIYVPKNNDIRERVVSELSGDEEFDYTCNKNECVGIMDRSSRTVPMGKLK